MSAITQFGDKGRSGSRSPYIGRTVADADLCGATGGATGDYWSSDHPLRCPSNGWRLCTDAEQDAALAIMKNPVGGRRPDWAVRRSCSTQHVRLRTWKSDEFMWNHPVPRRSEEEEGGMGEGVEGEEEGGEQ